MPCDYGYGPRKEWSSFTGSTELVLGRNIISWKQRSISRRNLGNMIRPSRRLFDYHDLPSLWWLWSRLVGVVRMTNSSFAPCERNDPNKPHKSKDRSYKRDKTNNSKEIWFHSHFSSWVLASFNPSILEIDFKH